MGNRQHARRHVIIRCKNGGRAMGQIQQGMAAADAGIEIKSPITDQNRIIRQAGAIKRPAITEQPIIRSHVVGMPADKPDPPMPGIDQVGRHVIGGLGIVHEHGTGERMVGAGRNADKGNVHGLQRAQHGVAIRHRGRQDNAIDMRFRHQATDLFPHMGIRHIDRLGEQADAICTATIPASGLDLEHVIGAVIVIDQGDLV